MPRHAYRVIVTSLTDTDRQLLVRYRATKAEAEELAGDIAAIIDGGLAASVELMPAPAPQCQVCHQPAVYRVCLDTPSRLVGTPCCAVHLDRVVKANTAPGRANIVEMV